MLTFIYLMIEKSKFPFCPFLERLVVLFFDIYHSTRDVEIYPYIFITDLNAYYTDLHIVTDLLVYFEKVVEG